MPVGCNLQQSPESSTSSRSSNNFQRRKIGSIRDNSKLFKILQQFENACQEEGKATQPVLKSPSRSSTCSAPSSFTSRSSVEEFFKLGSTIKHDHSVDPTSVGVASQLRRYSEGDATGKPCNGNVAKPGLTSQQRIRNDSYELKKSRVPTGFKNRSPKTFRKGNFSIISNNPDAELSKMPQNSMTKVVGSKMTNAKEYLCQSPRSDVFMSTNGCSNGHAQTENVSENPLPPPIPKRGLSLPVSHITKTTQLEEPKAKLSPSPTARAPPPSPRNSIKQNSVKKAIQIYEGLSSGGKSSRSAKRNSYPKIVLRKELVTSENFEDGSVKVTVSRKPSKRNSFKQLKSQSAVKEDSRKNVTSIKNESKDCCVFKHSKEDSGVGFSDSEDNRVAQGIYQTLCGVTTAGEQYDTYDRLNRIHDMVNRIHKGQSSTCAACKAIPTGSMQLSPVAGPSLLQVKCNELAPHHHPPCICFSCQHSVFSCSQNSFTNQDALNASLENLALAEEENLYYNVCCLNGLTCKSWRQSRRRPVCEQNGRLCVVNCDMEKRDNAQLYEKLFEWNTSRPNDVPQRHITKHMSDDSDEGWVDVTDSEDEKLFAVQERLLDGSASSIHSTSTKTLVAEEEGEAPMHESSAQHLPFNEEQSSQFYSKVSQENISRATSSEHLYESIADLEGQNSNVQDAANELPARVDMSADNDPDSGEWSTESSSSPTPIEHANPSVEEKHTPTTCEAPVSRFTVASDVSPLESCSKKAFKIALGKKSQAPKKKMSKFFVPWLVSNTEYVASRSPKSSIKKQGSRSLKVDSNPTKASKTFTKNKRSQSIPSCVSGNSLSCTKIFSSTEILDRCKSDMKELEHGGSDCADNSMNLSLSSVSSLSMSRGSVASSTYLRPDQLHLAPATKSRPQISADATDVSVEKVFRRCSSGESMHSYIVFRPIKEEEVPLYQFYERNMKERVALCRSPENLSPVNFSSSVDIGSTYDCSGHRKASPLRPQLSVVEQLSLDAKDIKMLWCELPEVKDSGILERISAQELKLQEAAFEFIQSQASYIRSLKVLYEHFICAPEFSDVHSSLCVLSKHEHDVLFSDIIGVKEVSERLMVELTARWSDGILIPDICDIIYRHATMPSFSIYIKYCSNRVYQERTLKELKETRLCFLEVLRKLESNPACQGLSLESFLFLPMQHIARLPLLLDSIFRWLSSDSPSFSTCKMALEAVHKTFMECNDGARKMERLEEMFILNKQLEFKECKAIPLISASRWLLKRGELVKLEFDKKTFGRSSRCVRLPLYVFLFNDLLIITKRKSDDCYLVLDYCLRDKVQAVTVDAKDLPQPDLVPGNCRYLISLTLSSNHQGNSVEMVLNCTLLSERTRWLEAIHPVPQNKTPEVWEYDCPQVQCVRTYIAQQPDELSLQESDVVTIYRKMNDGWYEGRRLRDGLQGWFPASYTMDIPCSRARASNLRQCYRLLMLSQKHEAAR